MGQEGKPSEGRKAEGPGNGGAKEEAEQEKPRRATSRRWISSVSSLSDR